MLRYLLLVLMISCFYSEQMFECGKGKYADSSIPIKCQSCPEHCTTCSNALFCNSCNDGFFMDQGRSCQRNVLIKIANCAAVEDPTLATQICTICQDGYWLKSGNICVAKTLAAQCETWKSKVVIEECEKLKEGFSLIDKKIIDCKTIDKNCLKCSSSTQCLQCVQGYYLGKNEASCKLKTGSCQIWKIQDEEECLICPSGYVILQSDKKYCYAEQCTSTYLELNKKSIKKSKNLWTTKKFHNIEIANCVDPNCKKCAADGKSCTECQTKFYLDKTEEDTDNVNAICIECSKVNAKYTDVSCTSTQRINFPWTCTSLTGNCATNSPTPQIGESTQSCKACLPGYKQEIDGKCTKCIKNCFSCFFDEKKCVECYIGYYRNMEDQCSPCDVSCLQCSKTECNECKTKFAIDSIDKTKCVACKDSNCERCDDKDICIKCMAGYFVKDKACSTCSKNCKDCDDSSTCFSCKVGNYLNGKVCDACIANCKTCTESTKCNICRSGYDLNADKTICTKSTSLSNECLKLVTGCSKCDAITKKTCVLCKSGSIPADGVCTCPKEKILISGVCVAQSNEDLPKDLSSKSLDDLTIYVSKALETSTAKVINTKNILARVNTILSAKVGKNNENAEKSLSLLLQFADTATDVDAQTSYNNILETICDISDLSESNFYLAFTAADKFLTTATNKKEIFELGFSACLTNLLKKGNNVADIPLMSLTNSEFQMVKFTQNEVNDNLDLTGISITINQAFMNAVGDGTYYAAVQTFPNTANPYAKSQKNSGTFSLASKIVSFKVLSAGENAQIQKIVLNDGSFPITFDNAGDAGKCGYYNTETDKWVKDGTLKDKTCSFTHLTDFAIYSDSKETYINDRTTKGACMLQALSILILVVIALF